MRTTIGFGVLVLGLGALAWWSYVEHADEIEKSMTAASSDAVDGLSRHGVATTTSGRDITATGIVHDEAEAMAIMAALDRLAGRRVIRDRMQRLPSVAPYHLTADKGTSGLTIVGVMPERGLIDAFVAAQPKGSKVTLDLAAGEPDALWPKAVETGLAGLTNLKTASLIIDDRTLTVSGLAPTRSALMATQQAYSKLPKGYSVIADIALPPNPVLEIDYEAGVSAKVRGNLPRDTTVATFAALGSATIALEASLDRDAYDRVEWNKTLAVGLDSLSHLNDGALKVGEGVVLLTGRATDQVALDAAKTALADLPDGYVAETGLMLMPRSHLNIAYDAATGTVLRGALPKGTDLGELKAGVLTGSISVEVSLDAVGDPAAFLAASRAFGVWLPEYEAATLRADDDGVVLDLETLPGANADLITDRLKAVLGDAKVAARASNKPYSVGAERVNQATGQKEVYRAGFWLPLVDFEPSAQACQDQGKAALQSRDITFLSGSADLDVTARAALNQLAAVVRHCTSDGKLALEIGGHTDNTGSLDVNDKLSQERADAVAAALVDRGVDRTLVSSKGYGPSNPIADNTTQEGRAKNRRTEVTWIAR